MEGAALRGNGSFARPDRWPRLCSSVRVNRTSFVAAIALTAAAVGAATGAFAPPRVFQTCALLLAAAVAPALWRRDHRLAVAPVVVIDFLAVLLLELDAALLVAATGAVSQAFTPTFTFTRAVALRGLQTAATVLFCTAAAALAYSAVGGSHDKFTWPWQVVPTAVVVMTYSAVHIAMSGVVVPVLTRRPLSGDVLDGAVEKLSGHILAMTIAAALAVVIAGRVYWLLVLLSVPLALLFRAYSDYVHRLELETQRLEVAHALDDAMCVLDQHGRITTWNAALERLLARSASLARGNTLGVAVTALAKTDVPKAVEQVFAEGTPRTLSHVSVSLANGRRTLQVTITPVSAGLSLVWKDVTHQAEVEHTAKRSEQRWAVVAAGAQDGLWEWNLQTQEFYASPRWYAIVGLPACETSARVEQWLSRVHPDDHAALREALELHLSGQAERFEHEHRVRHEDGTYRTVVAHGVAVRGVSGRFIRIGGSFTDQSERAVAKERITNAGSLDPLTGLCNRAVFVEGLGRRLAESKTRPRVRFAMLYLDLDRFKIVNDSLGHLVGDELLVAVSRRLESCVRPGDTLARLGGDEFAVLLDNLSDDQQANSIAFRIQETLATPFSVAGREVFTSASIGVALGLAQYDSPDEIMRDADTAMYHAKSRGKARHEMFDADMHARVRDRLGLENDLRHAVLNNDFAVHYQPIVSLSSGMCVGFESLVRWTRNGQPVSPATFVPMAEELGLVEPLGTWVMQQACRTFADWQRRYPGHGLDCITVNVSSRQLMQQNFLRIVEKAVDTAGLKPCDLRIEITETALMDSPTMAAELLRDLRDFGVKIYLDDFGTGYSSLSHLHKLPVDALKIDRSFVRSLTQPDRPAIVESVLALARTLNTSVVAEGIETELQARELERLGCTHAQGFLFSRPVCTGDAEALIRANQPLGPKGLQPAVVNL